MATYLITGGSGFFGSIMKRTLLERGDYCVNIDLQADPYLHDHLTSIQGDIRDSELMEKIFKKHQFDAIFHFAALLAHVKKDKKNLWSNNVDGTRCVLKCAEKYHVKKIIFTSSNCLWAQNFDYPITEEENPHPIEIYGKSKLEGENILLTESTAVNSVIFRCPTIIDEGRLGLLAILYEFIDEGRKVWLVGDGSNRYQFIYAQDLVKACLLALEYPQSDIFNIGSDNVKTFNETYTYVIKKSGSKSRLAHFPKKLAIWGMKMCYVLGISPLGPYQYRMISSSFIFDTSKIKEKLGFTPTLTNEEMMLKSYTYYHKNRDEIKQRKNASAHNVSAKMGVIRILKWLS
ncbi:NAD(P)-dependent oxidoreductase [Dehalobacter sp. DCM]|uniref:NAD-dependent epimerase/dehydratase family protein n=1 Tax=Dehalobacter sp. DCM TaxID=2907827 RepID=UPI003081E04D|nr:NAD(P)-dependent oxidoreductase [Dehalobacter sp. DCM]